MAGLVRHATGLMKTAFRWTAAILCFMTPMTQAQTATTGQIVGVVTDPSGALVVGAKVAVTSDAGVRREVTTGGNGRYTFPLLDPCAYRLEVTQSGFAPAKLEGIVVQITESTVANVALKVAGAPTVADPQLPAIAGADYRNLGLHRERLRPGARRCPLIRQRPQSGLVQVGLEEA